MVKKRRDGCGRLVFRYRALFIGFILLCSWVVQPMSARGLPEGERVNRTAVQSLIERLVPGRSNQFVIEEIPPDNSMEVFELLSRGSIIVLRGSSTLAVTRAFNWYLNRVLHTSVSWYRTEPVVIPKALPPVERTVRRSCRFEHRFFLNYCTFGYTMLWWQWSDWERLIDWMALNGITMPLAITGQEYVWQQVWRSFGLSDEQIRAFFTGPSHLPWHRMGNLDSWLGPLPQSFIDSQYELQKKILQRERALGMTPVLPAFAGHTPKALKEKYPGLKMTSLGSYSTGEENNAFFIDPMEPLFIEIQHAFMREQTRLFGSDHLYGIDPFNEMDPPSWDPDYLAQVSKTIYKGLSDIDPQAVWVQMAWTFYYDRKHWTNPRLEAMIKAVPPDRMILLDYFCEQAEIWRSTDAFFNAPYIWCYLGNFGGGTQMAAPLQKVAKLLLTTESDDNRRKMRGIGSTLEGFGVNRFMFEWLFEYAWDPNAANLTEWMTSYARSRTGHPDPVAEDAWRRLLKVPYDQLVSGVGMGNTMQMRPRLEGKARYTRRAEYDYRQLADILGQMLLADADSLVNPRYQSDLITVCRQVLGNLAHPLKEKVLEAYRQKDPAALDRHGARFLDLIADVDLLLRGQPEQTLKYWLDSARRFAAADAPAAYFLWNAKVLLTTWGPQGSLLTDYAARDLSGLLVSYYRNRWQLFFADLRHSLQTGTAFDQGDFDRRIAGFEWNWCRQVEQDVQPVGKSPAVLVRELYIKYLDDYSLFE